MTILSFTAIFVGLGIANQAGSYFFAFILVLGVFLGSTLWWLLLSSLASALRLRFMTMSVMRWVNWISGSIIFTFGGLALVSGLRAFYLS
jgi:arginine exporter protein ArgO